jgi:hypothetical protein
MKVPSVKTETWKQLIHSAERFRALAPWEDFDDDTVFGVKDPASGQTVPGASPRAHISKNEASSTPAIMPAPVFHNSNKSCLF